MLNKRILSLIAATLVGGGIIHAQTSNPPNIEAYTVNWTPIQGSVIFKWLNAPPGSPMVAVGDAIAGSATIGVPDGSWVLDVIISPEEGGQVNGMIRFSNGSSPVIFNPSALNIQVL